MRIQIEAADSILSGDWLKGDLISGLHFSPEVKALLDASKEKITYDLDPKAFEPDKESLGLSTPVNVTSDLIKHDANNLDYILNKFNEERGIKMISHE